MKKLLIIVAMFTIFNTVIFAETTDEYYERYQAEHKVCTTSCGYNECHTTCS